MHEPIQIERSRWVARGWRMAVTGLVALGLAAEPALACREEAMLVFDASGSMREGGDGLTKIDEARQAAADVLPDLTAQRPTGLVTYGGTAQSTCSAVELKLPPMLDSAGLILAELQALAPRGQTALTEAVWLAAQTLAATGNPATIVLVTDGMENCGYDPCASAQAIHKNAPQLTVHVIGFHLGARREEGIACIARATGGTYTSTANHTELASALRKTLSCPLVSEAPGDGRARHLAGISRRVLD